MGNSKYNILTIFFVEGIPGKALTAEDTDPETRCQNTCGQNEIYQINHDGIECKCRPGFGRTSKTGSLCESKSICIQNLY